MQAIKKTTVAIIAFAALFSAQQVFAYTEATAKKVCKKGYHKDDFGSGYSCNKQIVNGPSANLLNSTDANAPKQVNPEPSKPK